jgi:hypothetical protein
MNLSFNNNYINEGLPISMISWQRRNTEYLEDGIVEYPKFVDKKYFRNSRDVLKNPEARLCNKGSNTHSLSLIKSLVEYVFQTGNLHLIFYVLSIFLLILLILYFNNVIVEN